MNVSGNSTSWATAGAASAFETTDATATPRAQKLAAPSTSVSMIASQCDGTGTTYSRPKYELFPVPPKSAPMMTTNTTGKMKVNMALCGFRQNDSCSYRT